jgi:ATP-dependent Clp protease ATP-binding subunit ClpA
MSRMAQGPSPATRTVFEVAEQERRRLVHPYLGDEHLLLGMLAHGNNRAAHLLEQHGLDLFAARAGIHRIVAGSGRLVEDDVLLLLRLGVDVEQMRTELEAAFGAEAILEASRRVRLRRWWRGNAYHSSLCGPLQLTKRAQIIACTLAGSQGKTQIDPEHLLYGVLRTARNPVGAGMGRRGRQEMTRRGMAVGEPHPVQILLAELGIDMRHLSSDAGRAG